MKDLGLGLDQIRRMLTEEVQPAEIRGMLNLKKAQLEQSIQEDIQRLKGVESRLRSLESGQAMDGIIIKSLPATVIVTGPAKVWTSTPQWGAGFTTMATRVADPPGTGGLRGHSLALPPDLNCVCVRYLFVFHPVIVTCTTHTRFFRNRARKSVDHTLINSPNWSQYRLVCQVRA